MIAGYFGGYTAKMQDIGIKEVQRLQAALNRKFEVDTKKSVHQEFNSYSKRLVRDLEAKGIIRTTVEALNLAVHADKHDVLSAECFRTFPTSSFPATQLLQREEIETGKRTQSSIITAVYHGHASGRKSYTDWPLDLLYGFRGHEYHVDTLSAFEMIRFWSPVKIIVPSLCAPENDTASLTPEGAAHFSCGY